MGGGAGGGDAPRWPPAVCCGAGDAEALDSRQPPAAPDTREGCLRRVSPSRRRCRRPRPVTHLINSPAAITVPLIDCRHSTFKGRLALIIPFHGVAVSRAAIILGLFIIMFVVAAAATAAAAVVHPFPSNRAWVRGVSGVRGCLPLASLRHHHYKCHAPQAPTKRRLMLQEGPGREDALISHTR